MLLTMTTKDPRRSGSPDSVAARASHARVPDAGCSRPRARTAWSTWARASLYQTIDRLQRHGLVEVSQTTRVEGYPDRVEYAITDAGREVARQWLREMLRGTEGEYPEFIQRPQEAEDS